MLTEDLSAVYEVYCVQVRGKGGQGRRLVYKNGATRTSNVEHSTATQERAGWSSGNASHGTFHSVVKWPLRTIKILDSSTLP